MKNIALQIRGRFTKSNPITIVSGLPRSGTSLMMNMLGQAGLLLLVDNEREADMDNPKGYFEYERVKNLPYGDTGWLEDASGKVVKIIAPLLPYLPKTYRYRIIVMRRDLNEIMASQRKMLSNQGNMADSSEDAELLRLFETHFTSMMEWLDAQNNICYLKMNFNELMTEPQLQIPRISEFIGKKLPAGKMSAVIDPTLYRQRATNL